jgi:peptidoglycan-N-acetylglucosamine deacetylase
MGSRRRLVCGASVAVAGWVWPAPAAHARGVAERVGIPCRLGTTRGVAVTFDDGPHPDGTPAVLDALAASDATATFYLVGEQVRRWPALAARIVREGHEVAVHGYRHRPLLVVPTVILDRELERAIGLINDATGVSVTSYRPPYGVFSSGALRVARRHGLTPLLWSRWGRDWERRATVVDVVRRATRDIAASDVILLHDADHYSAAGSWRVTAAALARVVEAVRLVGEPLVRVSDAATGPAVTARRAADTA